MAGHAEADDALTVTEVNSTHDEQVKLIHQYSHGVMNDRSKCRWAEESIKAAEAAHAASG